MILKFKCSDCDLLFEAERIKEEYIDPIYGPCSRNVADCPQCGKSAREYVKPKQVRKSSEPVMAPSCGPGGCCGPSCGF